MWEIVRSVVSEYEDDSKWAFDELWLAANWDNCYMDGKHSKTTEEEWKILEKIMTQEPCIYSEEICKQLFDLLCNDRLNMFLAISFPSTENHPSKRILLRSCSGRPYLPYDYLVQKGSKCWCGDC